MKQITISLSGFDADSIVDLHVDVFDNALAQDWLVALTELLEEGYILEKNYCFIGFPSSTRTINMLCTELNTAIAVINRYNETGAWQQFDLEPYVIEDYACEDTVRFPATYQVGYSEQAGRDLGLKIKHEFFNRVHNHFELLQGTVWKTSPYYLHADQTTRYAIRQLNILVHELESLIINQRTATYAPELIRPSIIATWLRAPRHQLTAEHKQLFVENKYRREFGTVYLHWAQVGKTLFEVWRDENAPDIAIGADPTDITINNGATCDAINALRYYTGEFDVELGNTLDVGMHNWYDAEMNAYAQWLEQQGVDTTNADLCLGYAPIARINIEKSFGDVSKCSVRSIVEMHQNIHSITVNNKKYYLHTATAAEQQAFLQQGTYVERK